MNLYLIKPSRASWCDNDGAVLADISEEAARAAAENIFDRQQMPLFVEYIGTSVEEEPCTILTSNIGG